MVMSVLCAEAAGAFMQSAGVNDVKTRAVTFLWGTIGAEQQQNTDKGLSQRNIQTDLSGDRRL